MNIKAKRAAALKAAQDLINEAKSGGRDLTDDEVAEVKGYRDEINGYDAQIKAASEQSGLLSEIAGMKGADDGGDRREDGREPEGAKSLGEHFVKHTGTRLKEIKGLAGASAAAPEYKAATDPQTVGAWAAPLLTQVDRTIVQAPRQRLVIADLLGSGTLDGNAISYFVENGPVEGAFTTVAENGAKPQLHVPDPSPVTDALSKIAGWVRFTDEMMEDLSFLVSEINTRLLYELARVEEGQLLNGDGAGSNLTGLLNRSGVQTHGRAAGVSVADVVFQAITKVQTGAALDADGLVINPIDYQELRLAKDGNGQYFGGGYFAGQYGQGGIMEQPPVWGLRTVVSPAVPAGTALVGAFAQAATVYRKGGVRVQSTNSHEDDFTHNRVIVRAEERLALAVRKPAGLVEVNLAPAV